MDVPKEDLNEFHQMDNCVIKIKMFKNKVEA